MISRKLTAYLLALAALFPAAASCADGSSPLRLDDAGGHRLFAHTRTATSGGAAALEGPLALSIDSCLGVTSGANFTLIVFPNETHWLSPTTISLNGRVFRLGDTVQLGGGVSENMRGEVEHYCPKSTAQIWDAG